MAWWDLRSRVRMETQLLSEEEGIVVLYFCEGVDVKMIRSRDSVDGTIVHFLTEKASGLNLRYFFTLNIALSE